MWVTSVYLKLKRSKEINYSNYQQDAAHLEIAAVLRTKERNITLCISGVNFIHKWRELILYFSFVNSTKLIWTSIYKKLNPNTEMPVAVVYTRSMAGLTFSFFCLQELLTILRKGNICTQKQNHSLKSISQHCQEWVKSINYLTQFTIHIQHDKHQTHCSRRERSVSLCDMSPYAISSASLPSWIFLTSKSAVSGLSVSSPDPSG